MGRKIQLRVNDKVKRVSVDQEPALLETLRDDLRLTGTKYGCGEAQCGACTVVVEGRAVRSCITPTAQTAGKNVLTIEGLARGRRLHALQQAFVDKGAMQCGYCTAGMIMSAVALLRRNPTPSVEEIKRGLQGNICRCGTFTRIVAAVQLASQRLQERGQKP